MKVVTAADIRKAVSHADMVEALREGFRAETVTPLRHNHRVARSDGDDGVLLLMPSWDTTYGCVKLVNVVAANSARGLPSVCASILLFDADTGQHLALIDGEETTLMRTAAASALAASYLARQDATDLLLVGAGSVASHVPHAYGAVRRLRKVRIWSRRTERAAALARKLEQEGFDAEPVSDLEAAVRRSDMISCATLARDPLIHGAWLQPGQHLDLIGGFQPDMREADDAAVARATVFVDTEAAISEAGDIVQPLESGALTRAAIRGNLRDLCRSTLPARTSNDEITLFKSVGAALEDLAAARLIHDRLTA